MLRSDKIDLNFIFLGLYSRGSYILPTFWQILYSADTVTHFCFSFPVSITMRMFGIVRDYIKLDKLYSNFLIPNPFNF